jgi:hypothetical protein
MEIIDFHLPFKGYRCLRVKYGNMIYSVTSKNPYYICYNSSLRGYFTYLTENIYWDLFRKMALIKEYFKMSYMVPDIEKSILTNYVNVFW